MRIRWTLWVLLGSMLVIAPLVLSQEAVQITVNNTPNWNFASLPCYRCGTMRLNNDNTLFFVFGDQLVTLKADGTPSISYDISMIRQAIDVRDLLGFFIPFEDGTLVLSNFTRSGWGNFLYNYKTGQISQIYSQSPTTKKMGVCSAANNPDADAIVRIGTGKKFIGCSLSKQDIAQIHIFDLDNNTESIIPFGTTRYAGYPNPWGQVIGGDDGYVYVASDAPVDSSYPLNTEHFNMIKRYNPTTQTWTEIPIPKTWLGRIPTDAIVHARVVNIDIDGNIYYSVTWQKLTDVAHFDFLKISATGELIWHVTEVEFGKVPYIEKIFANDSILISNPLERSPFELVTISLVTPTPISSPTATRTQTP